jgi:ATP-dependent Lon protease
VREKVLAAHRSGLKTIILPRRNQKDLIDVPKRAREELEIIAVDHMDQVLEIALQSHQLSRRARRPNPEKRAFPEEASKPKEKPRTIHPGA